MIVRIRGLVVPLLAATAVLAACGAPDGPSDGASVDETLDGRTFVVSDLDDDEHEIVPGSTIRLSFAGGRIDVHAGCNSMSGEASVDDGRLVVESLSSTEMGCDPPLMEQDSWVAEFLSDDPTVDLSGAALTLAAAEAVLHLEEEVVEDAPLEGTVWRLESVADSSGPDGAVSTPPRRAATATLRIDGGALTLDTGCNTGSARVEHADGELRADDLVTTLRDCGRVMRALEQRFRDVLTAPTSYEIDGESLALWSADGLQGLGFRAD